MKTPTLTDSNSTVARSWHSVRRLLLLTALALTCGGGALGPTGGEPEPQKSPAHVEPEADQSEATHQLAAKLSSMNGIVRVGVSLFLCGLLSLRYPSLRARLRSLHTRIALVLGGVGLMVLPTLIVGHELLVLGTLVLVGTGCFLAHPGRGHAKKKA